MLHTFDYAIEFVAFAFVAHTAVHFVSGLASLWNSGKGARLIEKSECFELEERLAELYREGSEDEGFLEEIQEPQPTIVDVVVPFIRPAKSTTLTSSVVDFDSMTPYELRKACQKIGFKWRNRHGRNKHAKKSEMVAALKSEAIAG